MELRESLMDLYFRRKFSAIMVYTPLKIASQNLRITLRLDGKEWSHI